MGKVILSKGSNEAKQFMAKLREMRQLKKQTKQSNIEIKKEKSVPIIKKEKVIQPKTTISIPVKTYKPSKEEKAREKIELKKKKLLDKMVSLYN